MHFCLREWQAPWMWFEWHQSLWIRDLLVFPCGEISVRADWGSDTTHQCAWTCAQWGHSPSPGHVKSSHNTVPMEEGLTVDLLEGESAVVTKQTQSAPGELSRACAVSVWKWFQRQKRLEEADGRTDTMKKNIQVLESVSECIIWGDEETVVWKRELRRLPRMQGRGTCEHVMKNQCWGGAKRV